MSIIGLDFCLAHRWLTVLQSCESSRVHRRIVTVQPTLGRIEIEGRTLDSRCLQYALPGGDDIATLVVDPVELMLSALSGGKGT